ncbi:MAG: acyl-CoA dehydrogenase family protein [Candidatus Dormibacteria bacterium]
MAAGRSTVRNEENGTSIAEKAISLRTWLQGEAGRIESEKRIPEDVAQHLADHDLFRMTQPSRFAGLGCTPHQAWEAVFEVARGCGSCAWVVALNAANVLMVAKFSEQAQKEVFLGGKPAIISMLTGGVGMDIVSKRVKDGVSLSGRWRYASGIDIASWVGVLAPVPNEHNGQAELQVLLLPKEAFSIDHSSWNVLGMRGTGSKDISLKPTFVPEYRWMGWSQLQAGEKHVTCPNDEPLFDYPLNSVFAMSVLAPLVGLASAVAEEFCTVVKARVNGATQQRQRDEKSAQVEVAMGEATMAMLRRIVLDDADLVLEIIGTGRQPTPSERAAIRMRIAVSARLALVTAQKMFSAMGGSLLPTGSRAERLFRDLHAMSSHLLLQPEIIGEAYGRLLVGLELPEGARL